MLGIIRFLLFVSSVSLICVSAYAAWFVLTPVTANNVNTRVYQGCAAGYFAANIVGNDIAACPHTNATANGVCGCFATELVKTFGAEQAAHLADLLRRQVITLVSAFIKRDNSNAIARSPEARELRRHQHIFDQIARTCGAK